MPAPAAPAAAGAAAAKTAATTATYAAAAVAAAAAIQQAQTSKQQADAQASIQRQQADRARQNASAKEQDFRRQRQRDLGTLRANKGGFEGAGLLSAEDFEAEAELASLRIRAGGEVTATRLEQQATLTRFKGRSSAKGANFRAGASLLSGVAKAFK